MIQRLLKRWGSLLAAVATISALSVPAMAATTSSVTSSGAGNGLKISPVTTNLVIDKGQTQTLTVYIQNVTKVSITLQALINDFIASDNESGQPALLLDPNQFAPSHSLKRFVAPISNVTLQPGEQKGVTVSITIPKTAAAGGYYGAVRFAPTTISNESNVTLSASVGSLILVKVPGTFKEDLHLLSVDVRNGAQNSPQVVFLSGTGLVGAFRFQNSGDVQEQPFGKVLLKQGDKQLAEYELNNTTPRGNVLPDSVRKFTVNLDKVGFFGQYTLIGNFGYGSSGQLVSGETTFYVIPVTLIVGALVVLAVVLFLIFGLPRAIRGYNERVIRRASRR